MKFLYDYFPIICFFIAFKLFGIYVATAVTMAASFLQVAVLWLVKRRFEKLHVITLAMVLLLGAFTLIFHNPIYIKWKPSVIYWIFAIVLIGSQYIGKRNIMRRVAEDKIKLPLHIWTHINISWALFFTGLGFLNIYVAYHFSTNGWVNFKLFGTLGLMLVFVLLQAAYMSRFVDKE